MRAAKYCVTSVEVLLNRSGPEPAANAVSNLVEYSSPEMTSYCTLMSGLAFSKLAMMALSMGMRGGCSCIHILIVTCSAAASPVHAMRPMIVARRIRNRIVVCSPFWLRQDRRSRSHLSVGQADDPDHRTAPMVSPQTMYFCTIRLCTSCGTAATIVAAFLVKANGPGVGARNAGDDRQRH